MAGIWALAKEFCPVIGKKKKHQPTQTTNDNNKKPKTK